MTDPETPFDVAQALQQALEANRLKEEATTTTEAS
jgi:hypothetical protein